jgi:hypothetical protein
MTVMILYWPVVGWLFMKVEGDWTVQDAIYFMVLTLTTVGYGDVTPSSTEGRLLAVGYMLFNLCCLSFCFYKTVEYLNVRAEARIIRELDLEQKAEGAAAGIAETSRDEEASEQDALVEVLSSITKDFSRFADSASRGLATVIADAHEQGRRTSVSRNLVAAVAFFLLGTAGFRYMGFGGCEEPKCDLDKSTDDTAVCLPGCRFTCLCTPDAAAEAATLTTTLDYSPGEPPQGEPSWSEALQVRSELELVTLEVADFDECPASCLRTSQCEGSATPVPRKKGMCPTAAFLAGTCGNHTITGSCTEYQEWADALYVATYTMTTVGYGDIAAPKHWHGRIFTMFFSIVSTILMTSAVANAVNYLLNKSRREQMRSMFRKPNYLHVLLTRMDKDGDQEITELEFVHYMLVLQGKATSEDFDVLAKQFKELDTDGSGTLSKDDIKPGQHSD